MAPPTKQNHLQVLRARLGYDCVSGSTCGATGHFSVGKRQNAKTLIKMNFKKRMIQAFNPPPARMGPQRSLGNPVRLSLFPQCCSDVSALDNGRPPSLLSSSFGLLALAEEPPKGVVPGASSGRGCPPERPRPPGLWGTLEHVHEPSRFPCHLFKICSTLLFDSFKLFFMS